MKLNLSQDIGKDMVIYMNLISKKDLLAITGISYGQLYRWKRERLIPEEWFIKQSAYTGQETFFPREQILSRIKSILELKDDYSLEELARMLSPDTSVKKLGLKNLTEIEEISNELIGLLPELYDKENYDFMEAVLMAVVSSAATQLKLSAKEMGILFSNSLAAVSDKNFNITCTVFTVGDEAHMLFTQNNGSFQLDSGITVKAQIHMSEIADKMKMKYKNFYTK